MNGTLTWRGGACLGLCAALLTGCATTEIARDPAKATAAADEGSVLVSVTSNTGQIVQFDTILLSRQQQSSGPKRSYSLSNALPGLSRDTALFAGLLPAGEYKLQQFFDTDTQRFLAVTDKQRDLIGSFTVTPGTTSDLGRIVITDFNLKVLLGRSRLFTDNQALVAAHAPRYNPLLAKPTQGGWTKAEPDEADIAERWALGHPQGATGLSASADGEVFAGTRMGTALARDTEGQWRVLARTGRLDALLWTAPHASGNAVAVAVGELNSFFLLNKDGSVTAIDRGNLPDGNLFFIDKASDGSQWMVGVQTTEEAALYWSAKLDGGQWTRMVGDTVKPSFWSGVRNVFAWSRPGGVGFTSTDRKAIQCFDYATQAWASHPTPGDRKVISIANGPTGVLGVLTSPGGGFGGVFAKTHYSADCGQTWTPTASPYKVKVAAPLMLGSGTLIETGGVFRDSGLYGSTDEGQTWTKFTDKVDAGNVLWAFEDVGLLSVSNGAQGIEYVRFSADDGRNWTLELSNINFKVLQQQLNKP